VKLGSRVWTIAPILAGFTAKASASLGPVSPASGPQPSLNLGLPGNSGSVPWSIVILLTLLTLLPAVLLSMTPFVRLLNILNQTGISALAQANQMQQGVLSLLR
jgi:flagellar biosynthetic protein FliP